MAVSSRVGNALGGGRPLDARRTCRVALMLVTLWIAVPTIVLLGFPRAWASVFTDDEGVVELLCRLSPWLVLYVALDAWLAIGAGALTGCALRFHRLPSPSTALHPLPPPSTTFHRLPRPPTAFHDLPSLSIPSGAGARASAGGSHS